MKGGANPSDIRDIAKYFRLGNKAEDIARALNLSVECVNSFKPDNVTKTKAEIKVAEAEDAKEHKRKKDVMKKAKVDVAA